MNYSYDAICDYKNKIKNQKQKRKNEHKWVVKYTRLSRMKGVKFTQKNVNAVSMNVL